MIVKDADFSNLFSKIDSFFISAFGENKYEKIRDSLLRQVSGLINANFAIYQANMRALEYRRRNFPNLEVYSHLELKARKAGERRVKTKSTINRLTNKLYPTEDLNILEPESWTSDDIVYSVGDMIDRLIIEKIKTTDYLMRVNVIENNPDAIEKLKEKIKLSQKWSREVERFLKLKLREIDKKGYYECVQETRTYNLKRDREPSLILEKIDFSPLYKKIARLFLNDFLPAKLVKIKETLKKNIHMLAQANFKCYQANMKIIEARKKSQSNPKIYSDLDLKVRTMGEDRVWAKHDINFLISRIYNKKSKQRLTEGFEKKDWAINDIVYSVGDMIDRLIIEFIKISDYKMRFKNTIPSGRKTKQLNFKIGQAQEWSRRVEKYLNWKLREIDKKGYYECLEETRTYNLNDVQ